VIRRLLLFPLPAFLFLLFLFRRLRSLLLTLLRRGLRFRWPLLGAIARRLRPLSGLLARRLLTIGFGAIRFRTIRLWTLVRLRRRTIIRIRPIIPCR